MPLRVVPSPTGLPSKRGPGIGVLSCLETPHGQRSLAGYSPWGHNELGPSSDKTRPDSPVPTLQGPCGRSPKRRKKKKIKSCSHPFRTSSILNIEISQNRGIFLLINGNTVSSNVKINEESYQTD